MRLRTVVGFALLSASAVAQPVNVRVNSPASTDPEEVTIAINPVNPQNLLAGANLRYYYFSTDGGISWTQGTLTSAYGVWGDPCVIYDAQGKAYYGHLSRPPAGQGYFLDRIVVQRSTDGGKSWDAGVGVGHNPPRAQQDKEWLAADQTNSAYRNRLYCAWTQFDSLDSRLAKDSTRILFSRSTDGGTVWSSPARISDTGGDCLDGDNTVEGAVPAVGPNGEVYLAWSGPLGIMFDRSTDGGSTFGKDIDVTSQPGGWDFDVPGIYRCNGLPVTTCDVSRSKYRGNVYVLWSDQRNGIDNTDVFLIISTDGGTTWGPVRRVNDDLTATHQFFPWLAVDQANGNLYVVFYDRRNTTGIGTEVYLARSTDGGATFSNTKISSSPFSPSSTVFFGDYTNIAAANGSIYPIWMRLDTARLSVWTALVKDTLATGVEMEPAIAAGFSLGQNYPNPFNPSTTIRYGLPHRSNVTLTIFSMLGQEVMTLVAGEQSGGVYEVRLNATGLASGVYIYRLSAGEYVATRKFAVVK
jgi:hypothetical protein